MHDIEGVTMRSKSCVDVCFHAIFSPAMFNNSEMDNVLILFDSIKHNKSNQLFTNGI
jgi:hypothetical protein